MVFLGFLLLLLTILPVLWVNFVMKKYDRLLVKMPFNGLEFGNEILQENGLKNVRIEKTTVADHYDLNEKKVKVHGSRLSRKSLTSISIVCHEIGHAIQHDQKYKPLLRRNEIVKNTSWLINLSSLVIYMGFPILITTGSFHLIKICIGLFIFSTLLSTFIHLMTLDVELDASFNKAFPIIQKKVPPQYHKACRSILKAAAFTYVIGVFRNILSLRFLWMLISRIR